MDSYPSASAKQMPNPRARVTLPSELDNDTTKAPKVGTITLKNLVKTSGDGYGGMMAREFLSRFGDQVAVGREERLS